MFGKKKKAEPKQAEPTDEPLTAEEIEDLSTAILSSPPEVFFGILGEMARDIRRGDYDDD